MAVWVSVPNRGMDPRYDRWDTSHSASAIGRCSLSEIDVNKPAGSYPHLAQLRLGRWRSGFAPGREWAAFCALPMWGLQSFEEVGGYPDVLITYAGSSLSLGTNCIPLQFDFSDT